MSNHENSKWYLRLSMEDCIYNHNAASWDLCRSHERNEEGETRASLHLLARLYKQFKRHEIF